MEVQLFRDDVLPSLPNSPGIYKFIGEESEVLYLGKAKNIRKRVASYFNKHDQHSSRIRLLVKKAERIEFTIVETEQDALFLENSLIKKYQPKYNIQLKDGKTYPFLCIKNEPFPRIFFTRRRINDGSVYLGPYTSLKQVRSLINFIKSIYSVRTCSYNLTQENINKGKYKVCLEYHIGNCLAPCAGFQTEGEYNATIEEIKSVLKGNAKVVLDLLRDQMEIYAQNYEFERAEAIKNKINILENYRSKSTVVNPKINNVDVFGLADDGGSPYVSYFKVINGAIIQTHVVEVKHKDFIQNQQELLSFVVAELRDKFQSNSTEVIVPFPIELAEEQVQVTVPARGDKKKLLELAARNATEYKLQLQTRFEKHQQKKGSERVVEQLQRDFNMQKPPVHIECFDNSNIQGTTPVASMVVFKDGKTSKKDYRHYNIKTVEGSNDFASMEEVVYRRYRRLMEEGEELPQLILIDGGKGQLSAAWKSLDRLGISKKVTVAAIAKRLEEIYFPGDPYPLHINKRSESLKLLQFIRNEAHRFAITFHRQKRSKKAISSELLGIKGVGKKTAEKLLKHFKSTKKIKEASEQELLQVVGPHVVKLVKQHLG